MLPDAHGFSFEYVGLKHYPPAPDGQRVFAIFGRLVNGLLHQGEAIELPATDGTAVVGHVSHFQESFYEWVGLPFYHTVRAEPGPFCVFVAVPASGPDPKCPGWARQPGAT